MRATIANIETWEEKRFFRGSSLRVFWDELLRQMNSGEAFSLYRAYQKVHPKCSYETARQAGSRQFKEIKENYPLYEEEIRVAAGLDDSFLVKKMVELLQARKYERIEDRRGNQDIVDSGPDYRVQGAAMKLQLELQGKIGRGREDAPEGPAGGQKSFTEAIAEQSRLREAQRIALIEPTEKQETIE